MMAISEDERGEGRAVTLKTVALTALLGVILLLSLGIVAGAGFALLDGTSKTGAAIILIVVGLLALLAAAWGLLILKPWAASGEPMSPKTRKANNLMLLSGALGGVIGAAMSISVVSLDDPYALFSNGAMAPEIVIPVLVVWLLIVPLISWQWHRSVDEHEMQSYQVGGLAALYLYTFVTPAWWLASRGGLLPAPDTMILFLVVMAVWGIGWFWRRYR